ncbi:MAG: TolC family protein, partial [bacterium]
RVISSLKKAYYDVFYYQKAIEIYEEMTEILKHDSRVAEQKYRAGKEKQMNVLKSQVELARIMDEILTLKNKKYTAQAAINVLLDYPAARPLGKVETPEHDEFDFDRELIAQAVLSYSPALKAAFAAKEKAGKLMSLSRMGYLPDFMFTYKRRYMPEGFSGWDFGLNVNLPLYFWKQRGDIKSQTANASAAESNYKNMENKIIYSMEHVLTQIDTYSRLYDLYKTNFIPQAEQAWKVAQIGYRAGKVDFIDLLDAERSYLSFQIKFWKYCTEYKKYLAELEQIAGKDISELKEEK